MKRNQKERFAYQLRPGIYCILLIGTIRRMKMRTILTTPAPPFPTYKRKNTVENNADNRKSMKITHTAKKKYSKILSSPEINVTYTPETSADKQLTLQITSENRNKSLEIFSHQIASSTSRLSVLGNWSPAKSREQSPTAMAAGLTSSPIRTSSPNIRVTADADSDVWCNGTLENLYKHRKKASDMSQTESVLQVLKAKQTETPLMMMQLRMILF
ncbi:uncharacterized protein LOC136093982 isoform X3 [Hydra vulgaris]|uniref:uncharacterized protein LOC136093982 isoform X3 n=1 Tax=Hydra vulgaris TaxID=6087 RepID=UPI0032EA7590